MKLAAKSGNAQSMGDIIPAANIRAETAYAMFFHDIKQKFRHR